MDASMPNQMPFLVESHDAMRMGLHSLRQDMTIRHPVEVIQAQHSSRSQAQKLGMLRDLYGIALPAKLQIETQILERFVRMPGMTSSKLGLEALTGTLDDFTFESYLGMPEMSESAPVEIHAQMEASLKMGMKPMARAIL
ncbi:MAG: hypothetical protein WDW38_002967 [Sanguina aurantia]